MTRDDARSFKSYLNDIQNTEVLDRATENALAQRWVDSRDPAAADELVRRNLRFVVKVAMGYRRYRMPLADLVQEGNLGLLRAVEKFDPSRGTRLISYAVWWIKAFIQSHILQSWSLVRMGTTQTQRRLFYRLPKEMAAPPIKGESYERRIERIAEDLQARPKQITGMMRRLSGRDLSLETPVGAESKMTLGDRIEDSGPDPETCAANAEDQRLRRRLLEDAMARLPERQRRIVELRHRQDDPMTLRAIGGALGLSRERVRQLEAQAMHRLKALMLPRYRGDRRGRVRAA